MKKIFPPFIIAACFYKSARSDRDQYADYIDHQTNGWLVSGTIVRNLWLAIYHN